jgi:hypothetical protein
MSRLLRWFCLLLLPFASLGQGSAEFRLVNTIGTPLDIPYGVVVDPKGFLNVLDGGFITLLDQQGHYVRRMPWVADSLNLYIRGTGLAMDPEGNNYVLSSSWVRKLSPQGQTLMTFGASGTDPGQLNRPSSIAVDHAGNTYVTDNYKRLQKFDAQGKFEWAFVLPGNTGINDEVACVAADPAGNIYLLTDGYTTTEQYIIPITASGQAGQLIALQHDISVGSANAKLLIDQAGNFDVAISNAGVRQYDKTGEFQKVFASSGQPFITPFNDVSIGGIASDAAGNVYVGIGGPNITFGRLYKYSPAGVTVAAWGNKTSYDCLVQDGAGKALVFDIFEKQVVKLGDDGRELLRFGAKGPNPGQFKGQVVALAVDDSDNIYTLESDASGTRLQKFNAQGQFLTSTSAEAFKVPAAFDLLYAGLAVDHAGNVYLADIHNDVVRKFDQNGQQLLEMGSTGTGRGQLLQPLAVGLDGQDNLYVADQSGNRIQKFGPTGQVVWENKVFNHSDTPYSFEYTKVGLSVDGPGNVYTATSVDSALRVINPDGSVSHQLPANCSRLAINRTGTRLLTLHPHIPDSGVTEEYPYSDAIQVFAPTFSAFARSSKITGRIFQDTSSDCVQQSAEPGMPGIIVVAEPGSYYGLSDENGSYSIEADTGTYTLRQLLPSEPGRASTQTCVTQSAVHLARYDMTTAGPDFGNQTKLTPYLNISVSSSRRRRCFRSTTAVSYANRGFAPARAAKVAVKLPEYVVLISASASYTRDAQGNYIFAVGDLLPQQQGYITITDSVVCGNEAIRGLTVCTKAWITPGNSIPLPAAWNGGTVAVRGNAIASGEVRFALVNKSTVPTGDSLGLRLYTDAKLALSQKYTLAAGDSLVLRVPATAGQALRLEADEPANHPISPTASASVEAGFQPGGQPNPAFLMLPLATTAPTLAEDCQPIRDSYDPNDKQVVPTGTGSEHYTPTSTALNYQVRFQNTGSDVAYRVEVIDTLSADLDLSTLHIGAASHSYRLSLTGKARPVLTFTFDGINLPAKVRSEAGSQGFVQFSITPKAGLTPKMLVENFADIFFDFNSPVRTNTTTNRIYDVPAVVEPAGKLELASLVVSPLLSSFTPGQGAAGTVVTLRGQHFAPQASNNQVTFNGVAAQVLSATADMLTVEVPAGAATGKVRVVTAEGSTGSSTNFEITQPTAAAPGSIAAGLAVYPNPAPGGAATLSWRRAACTVQQVRVFDARGALLLTLIPDATADVLALPLAGRSRGLYLVLVQTSQGLVRKRLTVE